MPVLHLQYRGIERLQNLKVRILPALGRPPCLLKCRMYCGSRPTALRLRRTSPA